MKLLPVLFAAGVSCDKASNTELLARKLALYRKEYPNHACAVFKHLPRGQFLLPPENWIRVHHHSWFDGSFYVNCIPKTEAGAWLRLRHHGGYENWIYDASAFDRVAPDEIAVKLTTPSTAEH